MSLSPYLRQSAGINLNVNEFCYGVYNQCESFICLDIIVKNREIHIKRYLSDRSVLN
jgi:hypothetical protein